MIESFSDLDILFFVLLAAVVIVVGTHVRHDIVACSVQVFDLVVLLHHMRNSHGS